MPGWLADEGVNRTPVPPSAGSDTAGVVVWRFCDGKHDRQSAGLLEALAARIPVARHEFGAGARGSAIWQVLTGRFPPGGALPDPQLILGAGSACQWPMLAARRARGGRLLYLMKPTLPIRCFDLCLVPQHDGVPPGPRVIPTEGVLNDLVPGSGRRGERSLVLVGGPSRHHAWDEPAVLKQIASLVFGSRTRNFLLTDSRRTPASTALALRGFVQDGVSFVPHGETAPGWLATALEQAAAAWVTQDSVSMVFEALTTGVAVGLIDVPARRADRITRLAGTLAETGKVTLFGEWLKTGTLRPPAAPLAEAARCANLLVERWFTSH